MLCGPSIAELFSCSLIVHRNLKITARKKIMFSVVKAIQEYNYVCPSVHPLVNETTK